MTDEQLQQRANLYARQAVLNSTAHNVLTWDEVITLLARAFVVGYAAGIEESHRLARKARK